ncbi:unnamed protein product [Acanthoscelides obtectus]|uniref:Peptidase S1 domain-containing protein n=1 Tax=Acanthoscelides obtectus TaxID=200917 RepID=A0A9P0PQI5_ACAOB|nr:unnamed protein product [Acanthoscelides obtectus]CAK1641833.1 hypothetical protein AOBTE_LOCUS12665 [Acanthoscelides obtectus]
MYKDAVLAVIFYVLVVGGIDESLAIIDGDEVKPHSMPYMAAITATIDDRPILCGGSLIRTTLVLTSARCVYGAKEVTIVLGAHNINKNEPSQVRLTSSKFIIHPKYRHEKKLHDIALVQLETPVKLNENIQTIELPQIDDIFTSFNEKSGIIGGWGKTKDTLTTFSPVLRSTNLTIVPLITCELGYLFSLTGDQMCTSGTSKKNFCLGDAGSPLVVDNVQVGIASFGSDLGCEAGFPGIYTRMTSYVGWLLVYSNV